MLSLNEFRCRTGLVTLGAQSDLGNSSSLCNTAYLFLFSHLAEPLRVLAGQMTVTSP